MIGIRIVARAGRVGFCIGDKGFCTAGSSLDCAVAEALRWKFHAKTLNERFFALLMLLALARKMPERVRQRLQLRVIDDGFLPLPELRRLKPLQGSKSVEVMRHDITNNFSLSEAENEGALQVRRGPRGKPEEDLLRLGLPPNAIAIASDALELIWERFGDWLKEPDGNPPSQSSTSEPGSVHAPSIFEHSRDHAHPFRPGRPIAHPQLFFGRSEYLTNLFSWWERPPLHSTAILGSRLSGKTSLMRHLLHLRNGQELSPDQRRDWNPQATRLQLVLVDFEDNRLHRETPLLRYLLEQMALPVPAICDLDHFIEAVANQLERPTVVLLDHIGAALRIRADDGKSENLGDPFWESLRALTCNYTDGRLAFALSAHELPHELAQKYSRSSSFFAMFRTLRLGPLQEEEARSLIGSSPIQFPAADVDWLLEVTYAPTKLHLAPAIPRQQT
jgi:hypothetical protein